MANLPFPWRGEDLPANAFWFRSGSDGWDFGAQRQTSGGWDGTKANPSNPVQNDDKVCYGMPVYAIADGEVISAWRSAPENDRPGVKDSRNITQGGKGISRSANHVAVLGDDGRVILYAHMVTATVPPEFCREPEKALMDNAGDRTSVEGVTKPDFPAESAWVSSATRPTVKRGSF